MLQQGIFVVTASDGVSETSAVCAAAVVPHDQSPASRGSVLAQVETALEESGIEAVVSDDIELDLWKKLCWNRRCQ